MIGARLAALLPKGGFARNVGILTGGTAFAQGLMALSLPVLTRLYSPEDFSLLAVYMAVLGMVTVVSCLRLNIAIPLPERDEDAINLFALSLLAAVFVSCIIALPMLAAPDAVARMLGQPGMTSYLWMIPAGVLLASIYAAFQYWSSRRKRFPLIATTQMTRAVGGAGTQIGFGFTHPTPFGLIFGHMIYGGLGVAGLARAMWRHDRSLFSAITPATMRANLSAYRRFPIYSVPETLFNTGGVQVPILIVAAFAVGPEAGFLMLAMRVMGVPLSLIGGSVSQVYLAEAPQRLREGTLAPFTRKVMLALLRIGGLPLLAVGVAAPFAFPILFGAEWYPAGAMVAWMTPWFILQFIASPVSVVLHVTGHLGTALLLQAFGFVLRIGIVMIAVIHDEALAVEALAISSALFYVAYIATVYIILNYQKRII